MIELEKHLASIKQDECNDVPEGIHDKIGWIIWNAFKGDNSDKVKNSPEVILMTEFFKGVDACKNQIL